MSFTNSGKPFEKMLEHVFDAYRACGIMDIRKTDPPVKVVGTGVRRQVIFMDNPWVDFLGSWREKSGRMIALEAKSTATNHLAVGKTGGVTARQWQALTDWSSAGAAAGIIWECPAGVFFVPLGQAAKAANNRCRVTPEFGIKLPPGKGFVFWDVAAALRIVYDR